MNLPNTNKQLSKKKILIILVTFIFFVATVLFIYLRKQKKNKNEALISKIIVGQGIQISKQTNEDDGPTLIDNEIIINSVSTGEVYGYRMKDADTGEDIAEASVLDVITKDDKGNPKTLGIILQIFPNGDRETNIFQGPLKTLSLIHSTSLPDKVSNEKLAELFLLGSEWSFYPLVDPFLKFPSDNPEAYYAEYSKKYYGKNVVLIKEFFESGLTKDYDKPLLIEGLSKAKYE